MFCVLNLCLPHHRGGNGWTLYRAGFRSLLSSQIHIGLFSGCSNGCAPDPRTSVYSNAAISSTVDGIIGMSIQLEVWPHSNCHPLDIQVQHPGQHTLEHTQTIHFFFCHRDVNWFFPILGQHFFRMTSRRYPHSLHYNMNSNVTISRQIIISFCS